MQKSPESNKKHETKHQKPTRIRKKKLQKPPETHKKSPKKNRIPNLKKNTKSEADPLGPDYSFFNEQFNGLHTVHILDVKILILATEEKTKQKPWALLPRHSSARVKQVLDKMLLPADGSPPLFSPNDVLVVFDGRSRKIHSECHKLLSKAIKGIPKDHAPSVLFAVSSHDDDRM